LKLVVLEQMGVQNHKLVAASKEIPLFTDHHQRTRQKKNHIGELPALKSEV